MKKIFLFLIVLFASCTMCFAGIKSEIKFVQVADSHFTSYNEYRKEVLEKTVADINKLKGISFVVFTGDNIDSPNGTYLKDFVKIINKLDVPYYLVIGDHDVFKSSGLSKKQYIEKVKHYNIFYSPRRPNHVFKNNGFVFMIVDGSKEVIPGPVGYYKENTLKWLAAELDKHKSEPVIIFQHFPLVEPKHVASHKTFQAENYLSLLKKYNNVAAVVSGHYHINGEQMLDGIYHISTPSLLAEPNSYKVITVVTAKGFAPMIYTELRQEGD